MKKILLILGCLMALVASALAEDVTYTSPAISNEKLSTASEFTLQWGDVTWTISHTSYSNNRHAQRNGTISLVFGAAKNDKQFKNVTFSASIPFAGKTIKSASVKAYTKAAGATVSLKIGDAVVGEAQNIATSSTEYTWNDINAVCPENGKFSISFDAPTTTPTTLNVVAISVTYGDVVDPNKPAAPTFTPDGGEVDAKTNVKIDGDDKTKILKYWFGEAATAADTVTVTGATATVTITKACTLNAIAIGEGNVESGVKTASFTIKDPRTIYQNECTSNDCGFEVWGTAGVANPWTIDASYGLKASGYKNNENTATEGVMASPVIDLANRTNITLDFDEAVNHFKVNNTILTGDGMAQINNYISVVIAEVEDETIPSDWAKLADASLPETQSWDFYAQNPSISLDAYKGKKVRIGFKYTSTEECAGTWEIKNVRVKGDTANVPSGIAGIEAENGEAVYFNLQGVRVENPENGIFIRVQNGKAVKIMK